jgi:uncharacterized protein (TIGR03066 family)
MKTSKAVYSVLVLAVIFGLLNTNSYALPKKLIGMWTAIGTCEFISIQFREDGTFTADRGMDRLYSNYEGTYEVHGRTITLNVNNDPRVPAYTPEIRLRSYKIKNDVLAFTMNGKKCKFTRTG